MVKVVEQSVVTSLGRRGIQAAIGAMLVAVLAGGARVAIGPIDARGAAVGEQARAARSMKASETAHLHYISTSGSLLYEEGGASGTLPGKMRVRFNVGATFTGSFEIYTRAGAIRGYGSATPHGVGVYESFAGSLVVTGGTGRYAHARGRAGLYGTFNRDTYSLVVQTTGTLLY